MAPSWLIFYFAHPRFVCGFMLLHLSATMSDKIYGVLCKEIIRIKDLHPLCLSIRHQNLNADRGFEPLSPMHSYEVSIPAEQLATEGDYTPIPLE